jgi:hypothetical protein
MTEIIHDDKNNKSENSDVNIKSNLESVKKLKRIDAHYISHEIQHLLHFEKGFLFTVKVLLLRPGKSVRDFLFEDRTKYVKPVIFLISTSVICTLIILFLHIKFEFFRIDAGTLEGYIVANKIDSWVNGNIGYTNLIITIFIGLWIKIFFKNHNYNMFEVIVLLCFVVGEATLILGTFMLIGKIFPVSIIEFVGLFSYFAYSIWSIGQFFGERKLMNYIKSILALFLGYVSCKITLSLIAYTLEKFIT